jgi:predicted membrane channel-forming protein YqfA (hemolysin III family)
LRQPNRFGGARCCHFITHNAETYRKKATDIFSYPARGANESWRGVVSCFIWANVEDRCDHMLKKRAKPKSNLCHLAGRLILMVAGAAMDDSRPAGFPWNYDRGEIIADGVIHAIGICLGLIGVVVIIVLAAHSTKNVAIASVLIYAAGLAAMLGFPAAYNMWPVSPTKWILRRFDHSSIYLLIAGTYTPFIAQLKISIASAGLLTGVWLAAGVGSC